MIRFEPNALYSMDELSEMLGSVVSLDRFVKALGLGDRLFKRAVFGFEVLDAAMQAAAEKQPKRMARRRPTQAMKARPGSSRRPTATAGNGPLSIDDL